MENFAFYYTIFRDFNFACLRFEQQESFGKEFLALAKRLCELEAQTFLNDDGQIELKICKEHLKEKIKYFEREQNLSKENVLDWSQWRVHIALMSTFYEWCNEVQFFTLDLEKRKQIFQENPVDWYYSYHEFFKTKMDINPLSTTTAC